VLGKKRRKKKKIENFDEDNAEFSMENIKHI